MIELQLEKISENFGGLEKLHSSLPPHLQELMQPLADAKDINDYQVVLLPLLAGVGGTIFKPQFRWSHDVYHLNFYVFIFGKPSSGKGIANNASHYFYELSNYKKDVFSREGITPQTVISGNSTSSALINSAAHASGLLVNETEADTCTQFEDSNSLDVMMRKGYSNDPLTKNRVGEGVTDIERTYFSMSIAGTPNQAKKLIRSTENGLFSRIAFIEIEYKSEFKNPFLNSTELPLPDHFKRLGKKYLQLWKSIYGLERLYLDFSQAGEMIFTKAAEFYSQSDEDDKQLVIRQLGINAARIAGILTVFRNIGKDEFNWTVSIEDAETALKLTETLYNNSQSAREILTLETSSLSKSEKPKQFFSKLPSEFTTKEAYEVGSSYFNSQSSIDKYLATWKKNGLVYSPMRGIYSKSKVYGNV